MCFFFFFVGHPKKRERARYQEPGPAQVGSQMCSEIPSVSWPVASDSPEGLSPFRPLGAKRFTPKLNRHRGARQIAVESENKAPLSGERNNEGPRPAKGPVIRAPVERCEELSATWNWALGDPPQKSTISVDDAVCSSGGPIQRFDDPTKKNGHVSPKNIERDPL